MPAGPDIGRPEFIKAAGELGLDVRQAMQRLGVRSLEGLNLRESLEVLRRQSLRGDEPASSAPSRQSPSAPAASQAAPARPPAARVSPAATPVPTPSFEEEDEPELTFTIDGDDDLPDDFGGYAEANGTGEPGRTAAGDDELDELDELELDDVPDFGPPAAAASSRRAATPTPIPTARARHTPEPEPTPASAPTSAAAELIARLRAVHSGGAMSSQQRTAYRNIVANELGETRAAGLVRGIWNLTPDRLGAEQTDELLSWGKRETFADEATQVLAELRAERERAAAGAAGATGNGAAESEPAPRSGARGRPASRRGAEGGDL